jgi:hypothetical protein
MSYRMKCILITVFGLLGFYAVGLRETRSLTFGIAGHLTVGIGAVIYLLAALVGIFTQRTIERIESEKKQFILTLVVCGVLAFALSGVRSILSEVQLLAVLLDDLPKLALVSPLSWIVRMEQLTKKEANQTPEPTAPSGRGST